MHQDNYPRSAPVGRNTWDGGTAVEAPGVRDLTPLDGSIARSGQVESVFCARCHRWIDCHAGISPEVAWERHGTLFH
jgi:hypothetical protein